MGHHNLNLTNITYERAKEFLSRSKRGERWIANNTMLYSVTDGGPTEYRIQLHSTPIITLYENGDVRIRTDGWEDHPTTRDRLRYYLPRHLSIQWGGMKTLTRPHLMNVRTEDGHISRPLGTNRVFRPDGTVDGLHLMNSLDAGDVWDKVELFARKFAQDFLYGRMEGTERNVVRRPDEEEMEYALRLLDGKEPMTAYVLNVSYVSWLPDREKFYKENFDYYSPVAPKTKGFNLADWYERRVRWTERDFRPLPGTDAHQKMRKDVKHTVKKYFEFALGYAD